METGTQPITEGDSPFNVETNFAYHAPSAARVKLHEDLRNAGRVFAATIRALCPKTRETELAIEAVEVATMQANAAIARHVRP